MSKFFAKAAAIALIASGLAGPALAQNASGSMQLKGNVALACSISVQDQTQTLSLKNGENNKKVGDVTETCNSGSGYRITLSSANAGKLKNGSYTIDYSITYDSFSGALTSQAVVDRSTAQFGKKNDLRVAIASSDQYVAGDYSDTVTVTIAAK